MNSRGPQFWKGQLAILTSGPTAIPLAGLAIYTVPQNTLLEILSMCIKVVTSATAGSRVHIVAIPLIASPDWEAVSTQGFAASGTIIYSFGAFINFATAGLSITHQSLPSPQLQGLKLPAGGKITIQDITQVSATDTATIYLRALRHVKPT